MIPNKDTNHILSKPYELVVVGASAGGLNALKDLLTLLPGKFYPAMAVVQHVGPDSDQAFFVEFLSARTKLRVQEAVERDTICPGTVYIAPANYHLLIEPSKTFALSIDEKVNHSRPAIDVLFESAARTYRELAVGIVLTGANADGAAGLKCIKDRGGLTIVQDPETAEVDYMPRAAIETCRPDYVLCISEIAEILKRLRGGA